MSQQVDRYGLYIGLLKVYYMSDESGAYSGWDKDILEEWLKGKRKPIKKQRRY